MLRKLTVRHGSEKRLVIKSPVHTARVALLLKLFPDAQFIYIHRNPYEVFQSCVNMAGTSQPVVVVVSWKETQIRTNKQTKI